jgi:hypothetical protein
LEDSVDGETSLSILCRSEEKIEKVWLFVREKKFPLELFKDGINGTRSYIGKVSYPFSKTDSITIGLKYASGEERICIAYPLPIKEAKFWGEWGIGVNMFRLNGPRYIPVNEKLKDERTTFLPVGFFFTKLNIGKFRVNTMGEGGYFGLAFNWSEKDSMYKNFYYDAFTQFTVELGKPIKDKNIFEPTIGGMWFGRYSHWEVRSKLDSKVVLREKKTDLGGSVGFNLELNNFLLKYRYSTVHEGTHIIQVSPIFQVFRFPNVDYLTLSFRIIYSKEALWMGFYTGSLLLPVMPASTEHIRSANRGYFWLKCGGCLTGIAMLYVLLFYKG